MWLPVAQRELTVASRRRVTYWVRLAAPGLGLLFLFLGAPQLTSLPAALQGRTIFRFGALALFVYSALAGLYFTAESISSERREGTLAMLQLTGMREFDLLQGKLLASALPGIFGFLAAAPLLAIPFLLGGVTVWEFVRVLLVLLGTLFLSLAVGIFSSSYTATSGAAVKQTFSGLFSIFGLGLIGVLYFGLRRRFPSAREWRGNSYLFVVAVILAWYFELPTGSPCFLLLQALTGIPGIFPFKVSFTIGTLILFGMSAYFLSAAKPFLALDEDEAPAASTTAVPMATVLYRRVRLPKRTDASKWWLLGPTYGEVISAFGWAMVAGALHLFSNGLIFGGSNESAVLAMSWGAFGITAFIYFLFARRASHFVVETRRSGVLEVLLVTPITWAEILRQQRAAFLRFVWFPAAILAIGEVLGVLAAFRVSHGLSRPEFFWSFLVVTFLTYLCSLFATLWASIFFALRTRSATHSAFIAVLLVLIVPALFSLFIPAHPANFIPGPFLILILSSWLYILMDSAIWIICRARLNTLGSGAPAAIIDHRAYRD